MYWTINLKDVPTNITLSMATVVEDLIYSLDCFVTPNKLKNTKRVVYMLDTWTYRWTCLAIDLTSSKSPRYDDFSTVVHDQKIFTWGQDARDRTKNVLYCMDTVRLTLTRFAQHGKVPGRRVGHEACMVGNEMFVMGGLDEASGDVHNELMALDLWTMRWRRVRAKGDAPCLGATFAVAVLNTSIFVFTESGCDDQSLAWDRVWEFETVHEVWACSKTEGSPPPITTDVAVFVHGDYIYAFGGCWMGSDDFYRFCPGSRRWDYLKAQSGGTQASVLFGVSCLVVGDRVFVLGANDSASDARRSVRVLDFSPSLQTLCMRVVLHHGMDTCRLPRRLRTQLSDMTRCKAFVGETPASQRTEPNKRTLPGKRVPRK